MAPFLLIFTTVLVLISVHIMVFECSGTLCTGPKCSCPSSCSCLGFLVDCARQGLVDVPSDLPVWVQNLDIKNNNIGSIDFNVFSSLLNLSEIDLSNNQLRFVNNTNFQNLLSLQILTIDHNHLTELPDLGQLSSLTTLSLQHNEIHSLNSSILEDLPKLQLLDLSFNNLVDLPANTFGNSSSLQTLSLSHNRLVGLEKGIFDNLTSLESLKLNKNRLNLIPKELFRHLSSLQHLELNSNSLLQIEGLSFQGLSSLITLKLRHTGIRDLLDGSFYGLSSIRKLQLDYNNIWKITKGWLYGLNSLQRLYVNNNNISEIEDDAWDSGKRLLELDLSQNKLNAITVKTFDKLYTLKRLILSENLISYIEDGAFRSLSALQYLELKSNKVSWTIEDTGKIFAGLSRLKYLGLADNGIRALGKTSLAGLNRLEVLDLIQNELTTFEEEALHEVSHLHELTLNSSSLLCDCHLSWMSRNFPFKVQAKCGYPDRLKGSSVFQISPSAMPCQISPKPVITKEPHTKITLKGENVTLECEAKSPSIADIRWRKDGKLLQDAHHIQITSYRQGNVTILSSHFKLPGIRDEDEGKYQCVVSNQFGSVYSGKARITVHVFPVFTKTPRDLSVRSGGTARLECGARGQPSPEIVWRKDGGGEDFPAARERRMHVMPTDDVFFITGVRHQDAGTYSCTAVNVAGTISANATLTVLETPSFVKRMEDKEVPAGETAVLECLAAGSPRPRLTWSKDGEELPKGNERHFFTASDQLLIIVQSQPQDAGTYACEMSNTLGTEKGTSRLKVTPAHPIDFRSAIPEPANTTTGVIVIAVVICIVGTSVVWVIIIYHTRKRTVTPGEYSSGRTPRGSQGRGPMPGPHCSGPSGYRKPSGRSLLVDTHSGHSKDSGQQSSDELLVEDYHKLLLENRHPQPKFGSISTSSLLAMQPTCPAGESYLSGDQSREHTPLLPSGFQQVPVQHLPCASRPSGGRRSQSAEQLETNTGISEDVPRTDSDGMDSGFSTFPRSVTLASVGQWSNESPRFRRLPKDIPNDSGSFSIAGYDPQEMTKQCRCPTTLPLSSTRSCSAISGIVQTYQ